MLPNAKIQNTQLWQSWIWECGSNVATIRRPHRFGSVGFVVVVSDVVVVVIVLLPLPRLRRRRRRPIACIHISNNVCISRIYLSCRRYITAGTNEELVFILYTPLNQPQLLVNSVLLLFSCVYPNRALGFSVFIYLSMYVCIKIK